MREITLTLEDINENEITVNAQYSATERYVTVESVCDTNNNAIWFDQFSGSGFQHIIDACDKDYSERDRNEGKAWYQEFLTQ